jgi:transposase
LHLPPAFPLILALSRQLGLRGIVDRACPMRPDRRSQIGHGDALEFLLVHVAQHPDREPLYQWEQWAEQHSVCHLWNCSPHAFNDDRIGRALDAMAAAGAQIHAQLVEAVRKQYPLDLKWLHWDFSHLTFTDARRQTDLVRAGYGNGTVHQRQAKIGLHVTSDDGVPVHYELLSGNAQQQPRAKPLLKQLQTELQCQKLGIVSDRGGIGYEILEQYLQSETYFVSALQWTAAERELAAQTPMSEFIASSYRSRNKPDDAYYVYPTQLPFRRQKHPEPLSVSAVIVHSMAKQANDAQARQKLIARTCEKLAKLAAQLNCKRFSHADYVRPLLPKKIPKAVADIVRYELTGADGALELHYWVDPEAQAQAARLDGRYILVHRLPEAAEPDEALKVYKRQYLVESRFRNFRSDLAINPVWLHLDTRIQGLVLVYVIALTLLAVLGLLAKRARLGTEYYDRMTPMVMLRRFSHLQVFSVETRGRAPNLHVELNPDQTEIIQALNLPHPDTFLH